MSLYTLLPFSSASPRVAWAPPAQQNPIIVNVPVGFYSGSFQPYEDVILLWPAAVRTSEFVVTGGRHIRIIGGASRKAQGGSAIQVTGCSGSIFLEGIDFDMALCSADVINACGTNGAGPYLLFPDVYVQNCRVANIHGQNVANHTDLFQAQGSIRNLFIDKLTFDSNYQGISIFPNQYPVVGSCYVSRVNGSYNAITPADSYSSLFWNMDQATRAPYPPVFVDEVYFVPRAGQNLGDCVYPQPNVTNAAGVAIGMVSSDSFATGSFPAITNMHGTFRSGAPAGGDWCPAGTPGIGYLSPGYQNLAGVIE